MKIVAFLILITAVAYAQMPAAQKPKSDAEKIASAMQAGPKFVTQNATVLEGVQRRSHQTPPPHIHCWSLSIA
jgi:hypothetical protein